jgi:hypothetical protein
MAVWRVDNGVSIIKPSSMDTEKRLEKILVDDISIASPDWLLIGRQVPTAFGSIIDLLAIDRNGNLVVMELKKGRTPREVIAQVLDYGSWVRTLDETDIAEIFERFVQREKRDSLSISLNDAFCKRFGVQDIPESLNESHHLVIVASEMDDSSERIVSYLSEHHGLQINAVFFRVYRDGDREYLTRVWFKDPATVGALVEDSDRQLSWNGELYVSFGHGEHRNWEDATKYGFISAGGGRWYSKTLDTLAPGNRIWVNIPRKGYVGVGIVTKVAVRVVDFTVNTPEGDRPIEQCSLKASGMFHDRDDPELCEYLVGVNWLHTVPLDKSIRETGFFGNQNSACRPTTKKWIYTVERLQKIFGIDAIVRA